MLDIKFLRTNPDIVKENIKKKFQFEKIELVDKVIELDKEYRDAKNRADELRGQRNSISKQIGMFMAKGQKDDAENAKQQVKDINGELEALEVKETELEAEVRKIMLVIPNIIDDSVPIGKDDSEKVGMENVASRLFPNMKSPITLTLWKALTELTLILQERQAATAFTI